jgi:lipoprotein signal peptidase
VKVDVRTSATVDLDASSAVAFQLVAPAPATGVTVTTSVPSPQIPGVPVVFTASGVGSSGYQYRFYLTNNNGVTWTLVQAYSSVNTWTLPGTTPVGSYKVLAEVRTTTTVSRDTFFQLTYVLQNAPATGVSLTPSFPSPHVMTTGVPVVWTAAGIGSSNYQYRFYLSNNNGLTWTLVQDYSTANTWSLPDTTPVGIYKVHVEVRTNSTVSRDAYTQRSYELKYAPATGVTITPSFPSPHTMTPGVPVDMTAAGSGSTNYEYRFYLSNNNGLTWTLVQDYSGVATWPLPDTTPPGSYKIHVDVRSNPGTRDAYYQLPYQVAP